MSPPPLSPVLVPLQALQVALVLVSVPVPVLVRVIVLAPVLVLALAAVQALARVVVSLQAGTSTNAAAEILYREGEGGERDGG